MKNRTMQLVGLLALCIAAIVAWKTTRVHATSTPVSSTYLPDWNPELAAKYLNAREAWWQSWPRAQRDHGTVCISCHTVVPYAQAWPSLQQGLGQTGVTPVEKKMMHSVEMRVGHWSQMSPFYTDASDGAGKTAESHATEAVLNAVILASHDAGLGHLRPITKTAFDEAWALQEQSGKDAGGWKWEDFDLAPWESKESAYQGAALFAVALGNAPDHYANDANARQHLDLLLQYLRNQYASQPVMSQVYVLWASGSIPGLLNPDQKTSLLMKVRGLQQPDGGWDLSYLNQEVGWHLKWLQPAPKSDGCATALVILALEKSGMDSQDKMLQSGLEWLRHHQQQDGSWRASSLNVNRNPDSDVGRFMSDAATGYAVLALESARKDINSSGAL